mgnify:FL=1
MSIKIIYLKHNERHNNNESRIMTRISDYDIAVIENEATPDARYSIERNRQAFDMFVKGKDYREEITEQLTARLIARQLGLSNEQVKKTTHAAPHDVEYKVKDSTYTRGYKTVRIEVKSALANSSKWKKGWREFQYRAVKPNNFDYIFFYEVDPNDGLIVKWTTRKEIFEYVKGRTEYESGYVVPIQDLRNTDKIKLYDIEDFPSEK